MTWPPGPVNFTELERRFSTIWRMVRWSATTPGTSRERLERSTTWARFACGCMSCDAFAHQLVQRHGDEGQVELAGLDLGDVEEVVDEADDMLAGGADVAEIFAVAIVLDRAEPLLDHHFGKADDGVERRADLVADARQELRFLARVGLGGAARGDQFRLGALPVRDVAQHHAEASALARSEMRPMVMKSGIEPAPASASTSRPSLSRLATPFSLQAGEIVERRLPASGRRAGRQIPAAHLLRFQPEQRLGAGIDAFDDAVARRG